MIDEKKLIEDIRKCDRYVVEVGEEKTLVDVVRLDDVKRTINKQPKTDWILCEVDMPKELGRYIVTLKDGRSLEAIYDNISKRFIMYEHEVIAWQPLPAPYKKEGAENE